MNSTTLVVLAAGLGSRYGGLKQIDSVGAYNETLLDYSTFDALKSGFGKIVYVIRRDFEQDFRERLFDRIARNCDAAYVFQSMSAGLSEAQAAASQARTKPWGTVHALLCARDAVDGNYSVINADDYYGRSAYQTVAQHFTGTGATGTCATGSESAAGCSADRGVVDHAMVGYVLDKTMSRSGSVSRAVCTVKDGYLSSLRENTSIRYEGVKILTLLDGEEKALSGKEPVSMNFFAFRNDSFAFFEEYFASFLASNASSPKTECYLPEAAGAMISLGRGRIRFYESQESWFGMTYPEDRALVRERVASLTSSGYYPEKLWER